MRALLIVVLTIAAACGSPPSAGRADEAPAAPVPPTPPSAPQQAARTAPSSTIEWPLSVRGTGFIDSTGRPFEWRGVTAFRLAEMIAAGRESEAIAYLDWAASRNLNVVRVLLMAHHLFRLAPEDGRRALPRLLDLARERGIAVEVVALADTREIPVDFNAHVREVGRIALKKGNALVELANEPGHATQDRRLHEPAELQRLAALVPDGVVVALGSAEYDDGYAAGDYATFHFPREREWRHVLALVDGVAMLRRWGKPVINDEPIGAAADYVEGRRDNLPERFGAAAALGRFVGLGATFHYEGGLQALLPGEREGACLDAWLQGLALRMDGIVSGALLRGEDAAKVAPVVGARASFVRAGGDAAGVLLVDPGHQARVTWGEGWTEATRVSVPGAMLITARR